LPSQVNTSGATVLTSTGQTITTTAANVVQSAGATAATVAGGTAGVIVGGAGSIASGLVSTAVSAVAAPVIDVVQKGSQVANLIQNPSLGGALALLGQGFPPYRNELDRFASYNYVITLGCLTNMEMNFPLSYRLLGPAIKLIRSGGTGGMKIPTIYETDGQVEFFIDDLNIDAFVAPNTRTRHSNANTMTFKVIEPYSMGQFIQNLKTAALVAGHPNYLQAPYLLSIEFIGYDDEGNIVEPFFSQRHIPIRINYANMRVGEQGTEYDVEAYAYNEAAMLDNVRTTQTDVDIRGRTVGEVLQSGASSLTSVLNEMQLRQQQAGQISTADQYIITFPMSSSIGEAAAGTAAAAGATSGTGSVTQQLYESLTGITGGDIPADFQAKIDEIRGAGPSATALGEMLRAQANSSATWNAIGKSAIVNDFTDGGKMPFAEPTFVEQEETSGHIQRGRMVLSDDNRRVTFKSGSTIDEIIEEIIVSSDYARRLTQTPPDAEGKVMWFRIETHVYNVSDLFSIGSRGRTPRVYVYRVVPYRTDGSRLAGSSPNVFNTLLKQSQAVKAYNYLYTGQNKDIIDFNLEFNMAFLTTLGADAGQMSQDSKKQEGVAASEDPIYRTATGASTPGEAKAETDFNEGPSTGKRGGGFKETVENAIARMYNDTLINTDSDLLNVELTIHGDPYYLTDAGIGNFIGISNPLHSAITLEGAMNPNNGDVDVILNFRTPIDYDGEDGFVKYPLGGFLPIAMFSGVYKVITVKNNFSKGLFTQTLSLARKPGQDLTLESISSSIVSAFNEGKAFVEGTIANILDETEGNT
jgi:hypothetical protein